jgi:hypothetical protein
MDACEQEVLELCRRALGGRAGAEDAAGAALSARRSERIELLRAAVRECRRVGEDTPMPAARGAAAPAGTLAEAVAGELAVANAVLPGRQREVLALRELLGLDHAQVGQVMGIDPAAVAALLARARLSLRSALRAAPAEPADDCPERERALRALARRQDGEAPETGEEEWIRDHMAACPACERAHAAMLEASVCYRAWEGGR